MVLSFQGIPQIFKHSKDYDTGGGKERKGANDIIVALDGTGDFDTIQEAIKNATATGSLIFIKKGEYNLTGESIALKNNITIKGEGKGTIINLTGTTNKYFNFNGKNNIIIEDMKIKLLATKTGGVFYHMDLSSCTGIEFRNIEFVNYTQDVSANPGDIGIIYANSASRIKILNCKVYNAGSGNLGGVFYDAGIENSMIINNNFEDIDLIASSTSIIIKECIIANNIFRGISVLDEKFDKNVIVGNSCYFIEFGDEGTGDKNIIAGNFMTAGLASKISLGAATHHNSATGNIHDETNTNAGTGNVISGDVQY